MSKRYWSADLHLCHANICIYCKRPWLRSEDLNNDHHWISSQAALQTATRMTDGLVREFNMRVKPEDRVVHVGDFMNRGVAKGVPGLRLSWLDVLAKFNGHWTLLEGNHDGQNKVKCIASWMISEIGNYRAFVCHYPTFHENMDPYLAEYVMRVCDFAICGHVHDHWKTMWDMKLLNINVGVDVRKYRPVSDDEIIGIYEKEKRNAAR